MAERTLAGAIKIAYGLETAFVEDWLEYVSLSDGIFHFENGLAVDGGNVAINADRIDLSANVFTFNGEEITKDGHLVLTDRRFEVMTQAEYDALDEKKRDVMYFISDDDTYEFIMQTKQDKLTFDDVPVEDSENPVKSGGLYSELAKKANSEHGTFVWPTVAGSGINFDDPEEGVEEYVSFVGENRSVPRVMKLNVSFPTQEPLSQRNLQRLKDCEILVDEANFYWQKVEEDYYVFQFVSLWDFDEGISMVLNINKSTGVTSVSATEFAYASDVYTKSRVDSLLAAKQNALTFDLAPTANSNNPVTSGGIATAIANAVASAYKYKGSVASYDLLPTQGQSVGDIYNIETADPTHHISAGDNVAWNGTGWDLLSGFVDLGNYYDKQEIDSIVSTLPKLNERNVWTRDNKFDSVTSEDDNSYITISPALIDIGSENQSTGVGVNTLIGAHEIGYYTYNIGDSHSWVNTVLSFPKGKIGTIAIAEEHYTKSEVDSFLSGKADAVDLGTFESDADALAALDDVDDASPGDAIWWSVMRSSSDRSTYEAIWVSNSALFAFETRTTGSGNKRIVRHFVRAYRIGDGEFSSVGVDNDGNGNDIVSTYATKANPEFTGSILLPDGESYIDGDGLHMSDRDGGFSTLYFFGGDSDCPEISNLHIQSLHIDTIEQNYINFRDDYGQPVYVCFAGAERNVAFLDDLPPEATDAQIDAMFA